MDGKRFFNSSTKEAYKKSFWRIRWTTRLVEAFKTVYPKANVQRCVVYIVRNTLSCVRKKGQFEVAEDLKLIYCTKKGNSVTDVSA